MQLFVDPKAKAVLEQFSADIKIIGDYIKRRYILENKNGKIYFTFGKNII